MNPRVTSYLQELSLLPNLVRKYRFEDLKIDSWEGPDRYTFRMRAKYEGTWGQHVLHIDVKCALLHRPVKFADMVIDELEKGCAHLRSFLNEVLHIRGRRACYCVVCMSKGLARGLWSMPQEVA